MNTTMPSDPVILLSYINTQLRDFYPSLSDLCVALDADEEAIREKLDLIDYAYDEETNQFV